MQLFRRNVAIGWGKKMPREWRRFCATSWLERKGKEGKNEICSSTRSFVRSKWSFPTWFSCAFPSLEDSRSIFFSHFFVPSFLTFLVRFIFWTVSRPCESLHALRITCHDPSGNQRKNGWSSPWIPEMCSTTIPRGLIEKKAEIKSRKKKRGEMRGKKKKNWRLGRLSSHSRCEFYAKKFERAWQVQCSPTWNRLWLFSSMTSDEEKCNSHLSNFDNGITFSFTISRTSIFFQWIPNFITSQFIFLCRRKFHNSKHSKSWKNPQHFWTWMNFFPRRFIFSRPEKNS